jgi:uncharacterized protein YjbI with pentapeptide repeats
MASDKDLQVQAAVIDLITSVPNDGPITKAEWRYFQDMLVTQSRALMEKGNLLSHRRVGSVASFSDEEQAARTVAKLIAINIHKGAVPDYDKYSGIYCEACDFRNVAFPPAVDFTGAVLDDADFSGATLKAALFDNAEIAGVKFVGADLREAQFRILDGSIADGNANSFHRTAYLDHIARALDVNAIVNIRMPNFGCANLEGANFDRHALFPGPIVIKRAYAKSDQNKPGWYQSAPDYLKEGASTNAKVPFQPVLFVAPKFYKANMKNAKLDQIRFFTFSEHTDGTPDYLDSSSFFKVAEFDFNQGDIEDAAFQTATEKDREPPKSHKVDASQGAAERQDNGLEIFQRRLRASFYSVKLDDPSLPKNVMDFLKRSEPTSSDYRFAFAFQFLTDNADLKCTPRSN